MKPIIIIPEGEMSADNIAALRENDVCVVEAKHPASVKFLDPIPAMEGRTAAEQAAVQLSRKILNGHGFDGNGYMTRGRACTMYCECLTKGTALDVQPTRAEQEREVFDDAKREEIRKLAREEARAERAAARMLKQEVANQKK